MTLLHVQDLSTHYFIREGTVKAADDISFGIKEREAFGLAGESGCGKTTVALSIMKLLPPAGRIIKGEILLDEEDLVSKKEEEMGTVRWKKISMVFQGAMNALNPVINVGEQIAEAIITKENISKGDAWSRVKNLFELVGLDPKRIKDYPHEFSGGMRQRVMIAMALACNPRLVIADEPVTALDVIVQGKIIELLKELQKKFDLSVMLITHDLSVIAEVCNKVGIMYAGKLMECADATGLFKSPRHPYTQRLIGAYPSVVGEKRRLNFIPGVPPDLINPPSGCRFHPRCPYAKKECPETEPLYVEAEKGRFVACHFVDELKDVLKQGNNP